MSLVHSIIFNICKKNRKPFDPNNPTDYVLSRKNEIKTSAYAKVYKSVQIKKASLNDVPCEFLSEDKNPKDVIVMYIHGGGFTTGSSETRRCFTTYIVHKIGLNVVSIDYRLAPEHPFPAAPEDCLNAYKGILEKFDPNKIFLIGESAGANLILSLLLQIKDKKLPYPKTSFVLSPTVQYEKELDSYKQNYNTDCILTNICEEIRCSYLQSNDNSVITNPLASPLNGDFKGCSPIYIFSSTSEILYDDGRLLHEKLKEEGVITEFYTRKGMMHAWMFIPQIPESKKDLKIVSDMIHKAF